MNDALVIQGRGPDFPDGGKMDRNGISGLWYEATNPLLTAEFVRELNNSRTPLGRPMRFAGVMIGAGSMAAQTLATAAHAKLTSLGIVQKDTPGGIMFDIEKHPPENVSLYMLTLLRKWRVLRWARATWWTFEPWQGGLISPELAAFINADINMELLPEDYLGTPRMYPASEGNVLKDLIRAQVDWKRVRFFVDGEQRLPDRWDGVVFDFDKLL